MFLFTLGRSSSSVANLVQPAGSDARTAKKSSSSLSFASFGRIEKTGSVSKLSDQLSHQSSTEY